MKTIQKKIKQTIGNSKNLIIAVDKYKLKLNNTITPQLDSLIELRSNKCKNWNIEPS